MFIHNAAPPGPSSQPLTPWRLGLSQPGVLNRRPRERERVRDMGRERERERERERDRERHGGRERHSET